MSILVLWPSLWDRVRNIWKEDRVVRSKYYFCPNPLPTNSLSLKSSKYPIDPRQCCLKCLVLISFHLHSVDFIFETNLDVKWKWLRQ